MGVPVIAYGWHQSKRLGGHLLLVCATCHHPDGTGRGYVGEPIEFTGPFAQPEKCVFCGQEVQ